MPVSNRVKHLARREGVAAPEVIEYEITDPTHKPDLNGELGGGKVYLREGRQFVKLTKAQAKFYEDSGSLKPV